MGTQTEKNNGYNALITWKENANKTIQISCYASFMSCEHAFSTVLILDIYMFESNYIFSVQTSMTSAKQQGTISAFSITIMNRNMACLYVVAISSEVHLSEFAAMSLKISLNMNYRKFC